MAAQVFWAAFFIPADDLANGTVIPITRAFNLQPLFLKSLEKSFYLVNHFSRTRKKGGL